MKLLKEDDVFGANQLQLIQKIYKQSTINGVLTRGNDEKQLVRSILDRFGVKKNGAQAYLCIKAASFGSDDEKNHCLAYLKNVCAGNNTELLRKYPAQINSALDMISKNEIASYKDSFLREQSLYSRNENDFEYTIKAFDAVLYKKDKYFEHTNGKVVATIDDSIRKEFFPDYRETDIRADYYANGDDMTNESLLHEELRTSYLPIDIKYFYDNFNSGKIIPAGLGGSDTKKRTIWNYMEIWTTFGEDEEQKKLKDRDDIKDKAKEIINRSNMTDDDKKTVNALMNRL